MPDVSLAAEPFLDADDQTSAVAFVPDLPLGQLEPRGLSIRSPGDVDRFFGQPEEDDPAFRRPPQVVGFPIDLGGVLGREPAEAWLDAFAHGADTLDSGTSKRVFAARRLARIATWALGRTRSK